MARPGTYSKGIAKREQVLDAALGVVATHGYSKASVRQIAEASGLSPAGLLHYFGSKEELFVAILEARDQRDTENLAREDFIESFLEVLRHNAATPGLVNLYARLAADAGDPAHPAKEFFLTRTKHLHGLAETSIVAAQQAGELRADLDPGWIMRAAHALADGLQTAWLLDPTIDMAADVEQFVRLLRPEQANPPGDGA